MRGVSLDIKKTFHIFLKYSIVKKLKTDQVKLIPIISER